MKKPLTVVCVLVAIACGLGWLMISNVQGHNITEKGFREVDVGATLQHAITVIGVPPGEYTNVTSSAGYSMVEEESGNSHCLLNSANKSSLPGYRFWVSDTDIISVYVNENSIVYGKRHCRRIVSNWEKMWAWLSR